MNCDRTVVVPAAPRRRTIAALLSLMTVLFALGVAPAGADPAEDALAALTALSRQAEQATEQMHTAQLDLDAKLAAQRSAEVRAAGARAAADEAARTVTAYQGSVDALAAAMYSGGRTDGLSAMMTVDSPQRLIDQLAAQDTVGGLMTRQMAAFREAGVAAARTEADATTALDEARTAAEQAAAVRADVQSKQSDVQRRVVEVKARYDALTAAQRAVLADPGPPPPPAPAPAPEAPPAILAAPAPNAVIAPTPGELAPPPPPGSSAAQVAVAAALTRIGSPYSWGASGPGAFDCSGLVMWSFGQAGLALPHSSQALARGGQAVSMDQIQPGDIVNFYSDASHTGIYIGNGMMVHASTFGTPVKVAPVTMAPLYNIRRY